MADTLLTAWAAMLTAKIAQMSGLWRGLIAATLGMMAALGQAPWSLWPLTVLALALLFGLLNVIPRGWVLGLWAGTGYFLLALFWIVEPFMVYPEQDGWMAPFALIFLSVGMGLFWALAFALARWAGGGALGFIAAFGLTEWLRGWIFTGFSWAQIGHIWIDTPLLQWAGIGGALLLTLFTCGAAVGIWNLLAGRRVVGALTLLGVLVSGVVAPILVSVPLVRDDSPMIRLVQPNAAQHEKWDPERMGDFFTRQLKFSAKAPRPDLIVWPETAIPYFIGTPEMPLDILAGAAGGVPMVFGAHRAEGALLYNSLAVMGGDGTILATYDKHHLVPFGEYIPFGDLLERYGIHAVADVYGDGYASGRGPDVIDIPGVGKAAPLICYEGVFARDVRRLPKWPDFLLLITNDAWFGNLAGPYQHLAQARLRSVEMGLPMVRVANTGVSAMIDAHGQIVASLPLGQAGYLDVALPPPHQATIYAQTGDAPMVILLFALLGWVWVRRRRLRE